MKKKRRNRIRGIAAAGCLTTIVLLVVGGVLLAPKVKSLVSGGSSYPGGMPFYGPSRETSVTRGSVSEGISAFVRVEASRQIDMSFERASGDIIACYANVGMPVAAGDILIELDAAALERDLAEARADLLKAQQALNDVEDGSKDASTRLSLEVKIASAEDTLAMARAALQAFDEGTTRPEAERARAAQALSSAQAELDALLNDKDTQEQIDYLQWVYNIAEVKHGEMVVIPSPSEVDQDKEWLLRIDMLDKYQALERAKMQAEASRRAAEHKVQQAAYDLARLDREISLGVSDAERQTLVAKVSQAEAHLAVLQEQMAALDDGETNVDLAKASAEVVKAEAAVRAAEQAVEEATLVAPFDGVATDVRALVGQRVSAGSPLLTLEDASSMGLVAQVSEVDIDRVSTGMAVLVTLDAYSDQGPLSGTAGEVPRYGVYQNGLTTFRVPIGLDETTMPLFHGLSGRAIFQLSSKDDVLVVPAAAVFSDGEGDYVMLQQGPTPEKCYVETGLSDGIYTEIVSGLDEGETVVMPLTGPMSPAGGMMMY